MNFPAKNSRQNAAPVKRGPAVPDVTDQTSSWEPADRVSSVEQLQEYSEVHAQQPLSAHSLPFMSILRAVTSLE